MAKSETKFVVKAVKPSRDGQRKFYTEVGRLTIRETEKGVSGSLYLHMLSGDGFAVFPIEPKDEEQAAAPE